MIDDKKLIEEYYDKIVGGYDMGCRPEDCKEAELLGESCMECVMRRTGELIASQPPADQWIPCSEQEIPTEDGWYWITMQLKSWDKPEARLYRYLPALSTEPEVTKDYFKHYRVTAWKPAVLPEPYKGVE